LDEGHGLNRKESLTGLDQSAKPKAQFQIVLDTRKAQDPVGPNIRRFKAQAQDAMHTRNPELPELNEQFLFLKLNLISCCVNLFNSFVFLNICVI
jgi:hypothetical protein